MRSAVTSKERLEGNGKERTEREGRGLKVKRKEEEREDEIKYFVQLNLYVTVLLKKRKIPSGSSKA